IKAIVENAVRGQPAHFEFGGSHPRAYTHVRDIAGLVIAMLDAPDDADRIFCGSAGGPLVTTTEVAEVVRELVPGADVEIGEELSEAEKPVAALRGELSIENARTQLGWEPQYGSIRDGIVQYIEQYRPFVAATGLTTSRSSEEQPLLFAEVRCPLVPAPACEAEIGPQCLAHRVDEAVGPPRLEAFLPPDAEHLHPLARAVDPRLDPADEPIAEEDREYVVAPPALALRDIGLPDVVEVVQRAHEVAVPDER